MTKTSIQTADFNLDAELELVSGTTDRGGIVFFLGKVRDESYGMPDKQISAMELSHYPGKTEHKLEELREKALVKFDIKDVVVKHRVGSLFPGDNIVLIIAAAKHRKEAFEACSWTITELKKTVPFWKKEVYEDGHVWIDENPQRGRGMEVKQQRSFSAGAIIMSDKGFRGERQDKCGVIIEKILTENGGEMLETVILPDEPEDLRNKLLELCDEKKIDLVVTSGGTGLSPRDITPDVTKGLLDKELPGFAEAMRTCKREEVPTSIISRAVCGTRGESIVINLPGSPGGVTDCLTAIIKALPHAIEKLRGSSIDCHILLKK